MNPPFGGNNARWRSYVFTSDNSEIICATQTFKFLKKIEQTEFIKQ